MHFQWVNKLSSAGNYSQDNFVSMAQQPLVGQTLLIIKASRPHSDTPNSVGILWTSDQCDADTSTWHHTTLTRERYHAPGEIRNSNSSKRATADSGFGRAAAEEISKLVTKSLCTQGFEVSRRGFSISVWIKVSSVTESRLIHSHEDSPSPLLKKKAFFANSRILLSTTLIF